LIFFAFFVWQALLSVTTCDFPSIHALFIVCVGSMSDWFFVPFRRRAFPLFFFGNFKSSRFFLLKPLCQNGLSPPFGPWPAGSLPFFLLGFFLSPFEGPRVFPNGPIFLEHAASLQFCPSLFCLIHRETFRPSR